MTPWSAVVMIVALSAVAAIGLKASAWMRGKSMAAARGDWSVDDFAQELADAGIAPPVGAALTAELRPFYYGGRVPQMADRLEDLRVEPDDLVDIVERITLALGQPQPDRGTPEHRPAFETVGDLARYIADRGSARQPMP